MPEHFEGTFAVAALANALTLLPDVYVDVLYSGAVDSDIVVFRPATCHGVDAKVAVKGTGTGLVRVTLSPDDVRGLRNTVHGFALRDNGRGQIVLNVHHSGVHNIRQPLSEQATA